MWHVGTFITPPSRAFSAISMMIIRPMEHRDGCSLVVMVMIMATLYTSVHYTTHYRTISSPMQEREKPYWRQKEVLYVGYLHSGVVQQQ